MLKEMLNGDSHIYWYAKGKYLTSDNPFNDLRKIYAVRNGVDEKYISNKDILEMMLTLVYPHISNEHAFKDFVFHIFKTWSRNKREFSYFMPYMGISTPKKLLQQILSVIGLTQVYDTEKNKVLIPLDKPDFTILPSHQEWADKKMLKWAKTHMPEILKKKETRNV